MRILIVLAAFIWCAPSFAKNPNYKGTHEYSLKQWKGKKNVVLIFAPHKKNGEFQNQLDIVKEQFKFFNEKDAVLFFAFEDGDGRADDLKLREEDARTLRKRYKVSDGNFAILVVNKKSDVVAKKTKVLTLEELRPLLK